MTNETNHPSRFAYLIQDLMVPNAWIYWIDFLVSLTLLYLFFSILVLCPMSWLFTSFNIMAGSILLYRCASFLHEIVHRGKTQLPGFATAYNLLFGYVFKLPIFLYTPHLDHHSVRIFTTASDPEYTAWSDRPVKDFVVYVVMASVILPALLLIRLGVVPIIMPFLKSNIREWIYRRVSTLATQRSFERRIRSTLELRGIQHQENMCALYNAVFIVLATAQFLPWTTILIWYVMMGIASAINACRASINHSYTKGASTKTFNSMIKNSFNVTSNSFLSLIWSPLDTKFHCLHHMFPSIPYHSLGKAHQRLMSSLPEDHPYRQSNKDSYFQAFRDLIWTRETE